MPRKRDFLKSRKFDYPNFSEIEQNNDKKNDQNNYQLPQKKYKNPYLNPNNNLISYKKNQNNQISIGIPDLPTNSNNRITEKNLNNIPYNYNKEKYNKNLYYYNSKNNNNNKKNSLKNNENLYNKNIDYNSLNNNNINSYKNNNNTTINKNTNYLMAMKFINKFADLIFEKYDANNSGYLDVREIYPAICEIYNLNKKAYPSYEQVLLIMKSYDDDGNGLIDKLEFRNILLNLCNN